MPFLLMELLAGLRDEGLVRIEDGQAKLVEARLPHRVSDGMSERRSCAEALDGLGCPYIGVAPSVVGEHKVGGVSPKRIARLRPVLAHGRRTFHPVDWEAEHRSEYRDQRGVFDGRQTADAEHAQSVVEV
jgi:hypothetical protein